MVYNYINSEKKLNYLVVSAFLVISLVILFFGFYLLYNSFYSVRVLEVKQKFQSTKEKVNKLLFSIEQKSLGIATTGERFQNQKKRQSDIDFEFEMMAYLKGTVKPFKYIYGAGLWYEPYKFDSTKKYFGPYTYQKNYDVASTWVYNSPEYDYFSWDWYVYALPKSWDRNLKRPLRTYWVKPYFDPISTIDMITISTVMYNDSNQIIGLSTVDIDLDSTSKYLKRFNLVDKSELFLIHSESFLIASNTLADSLNYMRIHSLELLRNIYDTNDDEIQTIENVKTDDDTYFVFYSKLEGGLMLAMSIRKREIVSSIIPSILPSFVISILLSLLIAVFLGRQIINITRKLREKDKQFTSFMDNLPAIAFLKDSSGRVCFANNYLLKFLGLDEFTNQEEVLAIITEMIKDFDGKILEKGSKEYYRKNSDLKDKDGFSFNFDICNFEFLIEDDTSAVGCIALDITEKENIKKVEKAVLSISQYASKTEKLYDLYRFIHKEISQIVPATNFYIALYNEEKGTLKFPYFIDDFDSNPGEIPIGKTLTAKVIKSGEALLVNRERSSEMFEKGDSELIGSDSYYWLGVPLVFGSKAFGAMVMQSYDENFVITERHKEIFIFIAEQIALVIQRINAIDALKQANIDLEKRVQERTSQLSDANEELVYLLEQKEINEILLRESEERFKSVADTAPVMIFILSNEMKFTFINNEFKSFFDFKTDEVTLEEFLTIIDENYSEILSKYIFTSINSETDFSIEIRTAIENRWVKLNAIKFLNSENKFGGFIGSGVDITDSKNTEVRMYEALEQEKLVHQMKSSFISTVSHEYKTPLTSILTSTYLIEKSVEKGDFENTKKYSALIQQSVNFMNSLLNDVLTISKSDAGKILANYDNINLPELLSKIISEIKAYNNGKDAIVFTNNLQQDIFVSDEKGIRQILTNLLSNGIKYSPENSPVEFIASSDENNIYFSVKDYGIGIPDLDMKNLFEPFHRASNTGKIKGTGLGLSIVKRFVDTLGGEIKVTSKLNEGTKFEIKLPISGDVGDI